MNNFTPEFKSSFMNSIIDTLYLKDLITLDTTKFQILKEACNFKGYEKGHYLIYYAGEYYEISLIFATGTFSDPIRFDLPKDLESRMDNYFITKNDIEEEIHNVQSLLRNVLNVSESSADILLLMPEQVQRKCPNLFRLHTGGTTLTKTQIKEFRLKHEKMLSGLKQKILRDLLLKQR